VAGKFVDELKKLGALQLVEAESLANCLLFCVDKILPGDKRCIADCKRGGWNAFMGKDPTYLVRNESILPRLYKGGWLAVADASKQFNNFPTQLEEQRYLGCIHSIMGE
jgi:hypothetical protein